MRQHCDVTIDGLTSNNTNVSCHKSLIVLTTDSVNRRVWAGPVNAVTNQNTISVSESSPEFSFASRRSSCEVVSNSIYRKTSSLLIPTKLNKNKTQVLKVTVRHNFFSLTKIQIYIVSILFFRLAVVTEVEKRFKHFELLWNTSGSFMLKRF